MNNSSVDCASLKNMTLIYRENDRRHRPMEQFGTMFSRSLTQSTQLSAQADRKEVFFFDATKEFRCDSSDMDDDEWRDDMSGQTLSSAGDFDTDDHDPSKRHRQWEDMGVNSSPIPSITERTPVLSSQDSSFRGITSAACNVESGIEVCECDVIEVRLPLIWYGCSLLTHFCY